MYFQNTDTEVVAKALGVVSYELNELSIEVISRMQEYMSPVYEPYDYYKFRYRIAQLQLLELSDAQAAFATLDPCFSLVQKRLFASAYWCPGQRGLYQNISHDTLAPNHVPPGQVSLVWALFFLIDSSFVRHVRRVCLLFVDILLRLCTELESSATLEEVTVAYDRITAFRHRLTKR